MLVLTGADEVRPRYDNLKIKFNERFGAEPELYSRAPGVSFIPPVVLHLWDIYNWDLQGRFIGGDPHTFSVMDFDTLLLPVAWDTYAGVYISMERCT